LSLAFPFLSAFRLPPSAFPFVPLAFAQEQKEELCPRRTKLPLFFRMEKLRSEGFSVRKNKGSKRPAAFRFPFTFASLLLTQNFYKSKRKAEKPSPSERKGSGVFFLPFALAKARAKVRKTLVLIPKACAPLRKSMGKGTQNFSHAKKMRTQKLELKFLHKPLFFGTKLAFVCLVAHVKSSAYFCPGKIKGKGKKVVGPV